MPSEREPNRALLIAGGGAAALAIVAVGLLIGGVFGSGSHAPANPSAPPRPVASSNQPASSTSTQASTPSDSTTTTGTGSTGTSTASTTTAASAPTSTTRFTGRAFSIHYPAGWVIQSDQKQYPWGTDTTIVSPHDSATLLRVDVTPHLKTRDPLAASQPEIAQVAKQPGYRQLELSANTVNGDPGEEWEFLVDENGTLLHKVDEFLVAANGDGVAILTQAPASRYGSLAQQFGSLRQTISVG